MRAFTGSVSKAELLKEVLRHRELDNYIQGKYFEDGRGCAVGCAIESINRLKGTFSKTNDHHFLSEQTQVPLWLIRVQDRIFEGLSVEGSKLWPSRFTSAINEGSDLSKILNQFLIKTIESTFEAYDNEKYRAVKEAQDLVIKGLEENNKDILIKGRKSADAYAAYAAEAAVYAADAYASKESHWLKLSNELIKLMKGCK